MKTINFISPVPPERKKELRRWGLITGSMMASSFIGIILVTGTQWHIHTTLQNQKKELEEVLASYTAIMDQQRKIKDEHLVAQKKITKLTTCTDCPKNPSDLITVIRTAAASNTIQSLAITKKTIELQTICANARQAAAIVKNLTQSSQLQNVQLASLQSTSNQQIIATIKATRVRTKQA